MNYANQLKLVRKFQCFYFTNLIKSNVHLKSIHFCALRQSEPENKAKKELVQVSTNQSNDKDKSEGKKNEPNRQTRPQKSPLQRLLTAKDYADWIMFIFLATGIYIWYKKRKETKEIEKKYEIEWIQIPHFNQKLFTCAGFCLPEFISKNLNNFKQFKTRADDIWVISFPKSGTTWVQELVYLMVNSCEFDKATKASIEVRSPFLEYVTPGIREIEKMSSPRIIKTHLPVEFLPENLENKSKVIYILRNPKDVSVSYYHFAKLSTQANYLGQFKDFAKLFVDGTVPYGPWWKHVDGYVQRKNVHVIHYEDLHEKPAEEIAKLAEFLGVKLTETQVQSLIKWCSFENMQKNPSVNYEWYKTLGLFKKDGEFFRKGQVGDWLNHYSKNDSIALDNKIKENLAYKSQLNYGISDENLNKIYSKS